MTSGGNSKLFEMISCSRSMLWAAVWSGFGGRDFRLPRFYYWNLLEPPKHHLDGIMKIKCHGNMLISRFEFHSQDLPPASLWSFALLQPAIHSTTALMQAANTILCGLHSKPQINNPPALELSVPWVSPPPKPFGCDLGFCKAFNKGCHLLVLSEATQNSHFIKSRLVDLDVEKISGHIQEQLQRPWWRGSHTSAGRYFLPAN